MVTPMSIFYLFPPRDIIFYIIFEGNYLYVLACTIKSND
jgi:hypothetical protein